MSVILEVLTVVGWTLWSVVVPFGPHHPQSKHGKIIYYALPSAIIVLSIGLWLSTGYDLTQTVVCHIFPTSRACRPIEVQPSTAPSPLARPGQQPAETEPKPAPAPVLSITGVIVMEAGRSLANLVDTTYAFEAPASPTLSIHYSGALDGALMEALALRDRRPVGACADMNLQEAGSADCAISPALDAGRYDLQLRVNGQVIGTYHFSVIEPAPFAPPPNPGDRVQTPKTGSTANEEGAFGNQAPAQVTAPPSISTARNRPSSTPTLSTCILENGTQAPMTYEQCRAQSGTFYRGQ